MAELQPVSEKNIDGLQRPHDPVGAGAPPSAGPRPWHVYEVTPTTVFGLGTDEPYGATRLAFRVRRPS